MNPNMNQRGIVWIHDRCPSGMMRRKLVFSYIGACIRCRPSAPNGFGSIGRKAIKGMLSSWRKTINRALAIRNSHHRLQRNFSMPTNGLSCSRRVEPSKTYFELIFEMSHYHPGIFNATNYFVCRYVVLTSKHHDGYALWDSKYSFSWNSMDVGPHRDLVGELASAIRKNTSLVFGLYHSLFEWFHPLYKSDVASNFTENVFVTSKASIWTMAWNFKLSLTPPSVCSLQY